MTWSKRVYLVNAGIATGILISYLLRMPVRALVKGAILLFALANVMMLAERWDRNRLK